MIPTFKFALREDLKDEKQFLPTRGEPKATGYDVRSTVSITLNPGDCFKIPLGFRAFPEEGWWYQLHPRSSSFVKKHLHCLIGIIDQTYANEVIFAGKYMPENNDTLTINYGDAIGQIIPVERQAMNIVDITNKEYDMLCKERNAVRNGGFGSTDKESHHIHKEEMETRYVNVAEEEK